MKVGDSCKYKGYQATVTEIHCQGRAACVRMEKWVDIQDLVVDVPNEDGPNASDAVENSPDLPDLDRAEEVAKIIQSMELMGQIKKDLFYRLMGWDDTETEH